MTMEDLNKKIIKAYKSWMEWDSYESGRKGDLYFNFDKMEFGLIQHTDRNSSGFIGDNEFWIPVSDIIREIEDEVCRETKGEEIIIEIEKYIAIELERRGLELA